MDRQRHPRISLTAPKTPIDLGSEWLHSQRVFSDRRCSSNRETASGNSAQHWLLLEKSRQKRMKKMLMMVTMMMITMTDSLPACFFFHPLSPLHPRTNTNSSLITVTSLPSLLITSHPFHSFTVVCPTRHLSYHFCSLSALHLPSLLTADRLPSLPLFYFYPLDSLPFQSSSLSASLLPSPPLAFPLSHSGTRLPSLLQFSSRCHYPELATTLLPSLLLSSSHCHSLPLAIILRNSLPPSFFLPSSTAAASAFRAAVQAGQESVLACSSGKRDK